MKFYSVLIHDFVWCLTLLCACPLFAAAADLSGRMMEHHSHLRPEDVAVIYNLNDANSEAVARYYMQARHIPLPQLIAVNLPANSPEVLSVEAFNDLQKQITSRLTHEQVLVLVWRAPYAVQCNSLTAALSMGLDLHQCDNPCGVGRENPYYNSRSLQPMADHQLRLSMLLPVSKVEDAKALIDRGVLSEFALNEAHGYFLKTADAARSKPREPFFLPDGSTIQAKRLTIHSPSQETLENAASVMFYLTGQKQVSGLATNQYLPGAIADHLTSTGGVLSEHNAQMPASRWLEAGVTGSYGTVSEPCNYWEKFPNPQVLLNHYLAGETLIEAYWKSVKWPMQGLFIGEPLAKPYARRVTPKQE